MRKRLTWWTAVLVAVAVATGCSRTSSIQALPPRPAVPIDSTDTELADAGLARLDVRLQVGGAALPGEVSRLRFRPTEIRFFQRGGAWVGFPASAGAIAIARGEEIERTILSTQVAPVAFDSVQVTFADVYVEFGASAGGPIASASPPRSTRSVTLSPRLGERTGVLLTLNPGASVFRDAACNWHFLPFLSAEVR